MCAYDIDTRVDVICVVFRSSSKARKRLFRAGQGDSLYLIRLISVLYSRSVDPVESVECGHFIRFRIGWVVQNLLDNVLNGSVEMHDTMTEVDQLGCIFRGKAND